MSDLPIKITVDSVCDLPDEFLKQYGIIQFNYLVETAGGRFIDNKEIGSEDLLTYMMIPTNRANSAAPLVSDYRTFFEKETADGFQVIHLTMGAMSSSGYGNACRAAVGLDVRVVDSYSLSSTLGLIAIRAAKLAILGRDADTIIKEIETYRSFQKCSFMIKTSEYLHRSGRLSSTVKELSERFLLRPVLKMSKGAIRFKTFVMGDWEWSMRRYVAIALSNTRGIDNSIVFITHVGLSDEELIFVEKEISRRYKFKQIVPVRASAAISCNCGEGTFGILFARGKALEVPDERLIEVTKEPVPEDVLPDEIEDRDLFNSDPDIIPENHISEADEKKNLMMQLAFLDVNTGLGYTGGNLPLYREIIGEYARINRSEKLNSYLAMGDWENYRVAIHALRSSSKTIGAVELSESVRLLENACKEGDYDYIQQNHALVMMQYNEVYQQCREANLS